MDGILCLRQVYNEQQIDGFNYYLIIKMVTNRQATIIIIICACMVRNVISTTLESIVVSNNAYNKIYNSADFADEEISLSSLFDGFTVNFTELIEVKLQAEMTDLVLDGFIDMSSITDESETPDSFSLSDTFQISNQCTSTDPVKNIFNHRYDFEAYELDETEPLISSQQRDDVYSFCACSLSKYDDKQKIIEASFINNQAFNIKGYAVKGDKLIADLSNNIQLSINNSDGVKTACFVSQNYQATRNFLNNTDTGWEYQPCKQCTNTNGCNFTASSFTLLKFCNENQECRMNVCGFKLFGEPVLPSASLSGGLVQNIWDNIPHISFVNDGSSGLVMKIKRDQKFAYKVKLQYRQSINDSFTDSNLFKISTRPSIETPIYCSKTIDTRSAEIILDRFNCQPDCNDSMIYSHYLSNEGASILDPSDSALKISVQDISSQRVLKIDNPEILAEGSETNLKVLAKSRNYYNQLSRPYFSEIFTLHRDLGSNSTIYTIKNEVGKSLTDISLDLKVLRVTSSIQYEHTFTIQGQISCGEQYSLLNIYGPNSFITLYVTQSSAGTTSLVIKFNRDQIASSIQQISQENNLDTILYSQTLKIEIVDIILTAPSIDSQSYYLSNSNESYEVYPFLTNPPDQDVEYKISKSNTTLQNLDQNIQILQSSGKVQIIVDVSNVFSQTVYLYGSAVHVSNTSHMYESFSNPFNITVQAPYLIPSKVNSQTFISQTGTQNISFEEFATFPDLYEMSYKVSNTNTSLDDVNWRVVQNTILVNVSEALNKTYFLYGHLTNFPDVFIFSEPFAINVIQPTLTPSVIGPQVFPLGDRIKNLYVAPFSISPNELNVTYKLSTSNTSLVNVNWTIIYEQQSPQITIQVDVSTASETSVYLYAILSDYPSYFKFSDPFQITIKQPPSFSEPIQNPIVVDFNLIDSFQFQIPFTPIDGVTLQVYNLDQNFMSFDSESNIITLSNVDGSQSGDFTVTLIITDSDLLSGQQDAIFRVAEEQIEDTSTLEEQIEETQLEEVIDKQDETPENIKAKFAEAITSKFQAELEEFQQAQQKKKVQDPIKPNISIEEVSRNGMLVIEANQKIEYSKLFKDLFMEERRLNEANQSASSLQTGIKTEDLINVTLVKQPLPENQKNMTYEMNYSLTNFSDTGFEIQLNFSEPDYVSLQKEPDLVFVSINFPAMIFSMENGLPLEDNSSVISFELPKQFPKGIDQEIVEQQIGTAINTVGIVPIIGIIIQIYLMHDSGYIFPFLLRVQYVTFFALFVENFNMTPLSEIFIQKVAQIMLRQDLTVPGLIKLFGMEEKVTRMLGWSMEKFQVITGQMNQMWMILIMLTIGFVLYLYLVCIHCCFKDGYAIYFFTQMKLIFLWDSVIWNSMFQHKNNLFAAVQAYYGMEGDEQIWSTFNFIMYSTTIILHFVIIGGFLFKTSNKDLRQDKENRHKFESSTYFYVKLDDKYKLTKFENIFQASRSLLFMAIPLVIIDSAWKVFLTLEIFSIITFVSYVQRNPHYKKHKFWIILNDCYLHFIQFHYIAYTDLIPDPKTKFFVDISYLANVLVYCCANITYCVYVQLMSVKRYKELLADRKRYRENQKQLKEAKSIEEKIKVDIKEKVEARIKQIDIKYILPPPDEIWGTDEKPGLHSFRPKFDIPPAEEIQGTMESNGSSHVSNPISMPDLPPADVMESERSSKECKPIPFENRNEQNYFARPQRDQDNICVIEEYDPNKIDYSSQQWGWQDLNLRMKSKKVSTIKPIQFN